MMKCLGLVILIALMTFVSGCTLTEENKDLFAKEIQDKYNQINDYKVVIISETSKGDKKQVLRAVKKPDKWKDEKVLSNGQIEGTYEICNSGLDKDISWNYKEGDDHVTKLMYNSAWCNERVKEFFDVFTALKEILNETKYDVTITIIEENGKKIVKAEIINKLIRVAGAKDTYWLDYESYMIVRHKYEDSMLSITENFENWEINEGIQDSEFEPTIGPGMQVKIIDMTQKNSKNMDMYSNKEVFLISDENWKDVLTFVPVAVWTDSSGLNKYPYLIFHVEDPGFDVDSIIHFLKQYDAEKITVVGDYPESLTGLLKTELGLQDSQLNYIDVSKYRYYWRNHERMVYVEDNYDSALLASTYASLNNIPLIIQNSTLDMPSTFKKSNVILVGSVSCPPLEATCNEHYTKEELKLKYLEETGTDKIILINPNDLDIFVNESFVTEKSGSTISRLYTKTSLAAPILASAKHELIISVSSNNYTHVDNQIEDEINRINMGPEYMTILASPNAIDMSFIQSGVLRKVADKLYYNLGNDDVIEMKGGRIFSITTSDVSSYINRDLFYEKIDHNPNDVLFISDQLAEPCIYDGLFSYFGYNSQFEVIDDNIDNSHLANKTFILFADHGTPYSWGGIIRSDEIPDLKNSIIIADACSTCAFEKAYHSKKSLFCARAIRKGALGYLGAVETSGVLNSLKQTIQLFSSKELASLSHNLYIQDHFVLIGDPLLEIGVQNKIPAPSISYNNPGSSSEDIIVTFKKGNFCDVNLINDGFLYKQDVIQENGGYIFFNLTPEVYNEENLNFIYSLSDGGFDENCYSWGEDECFITLDIYEKYTKKYLIFKYRWDLKKSGNFTIESFDEVNLTINITKNLPILAIENITADFEDAQWNGKTYEVPVEMEIENVGESCSSLRGLFCLDFCPNFNLFEFSEDYNLTIDDKIIIRDKVTMFPLQNHNLIGYVKCLSIAGNNSWLNKSVTINVPEAPQ